MIPRFMIRDREDWDVLYTLVEDRVAELNNASRDYLSKSGSDYDDLLDSTNKEAAELIGIQRELQKIKHYARKISH